MPTISFSSCLTPSIHNIYSIRRAHLMGFFLPLCRFANETRKQTKNKKLNVFVAFFTRPLIQLSSRPRFNTDYWRIWRTRLRCLIQSNAFSFSIGIDFVLIHIKSNVIARQLLIWSHVQSFGAASATSNKDSVGKDKRWSRVVLYKPPVTIGCKGDVDNVRWWRRRQLYD